MDVPREGHGQSHYFGCDVRCVLNFGSTPCITVRLTSIYNPQIEDKSHVTAAGLTNLFMLARTSLLSELVLATIKKVVTPLEVGQTFGFN